MTRRDLDLVLLNEATPVIGDVAMETITEMIITESAMIGHNPSTPGGVGLGRGTTIALDRLLGTPPDGPWIVVIPGTVEFRDAARQLNEAAARNLHVTGAIVQKDDGVLIHNRLHQPIPIVDEVRHIDRVPLGMPAAVEVALPGKAIDKLVQPLRHRHPLRPRPGGDQAHRPGGARAHRHAQRGGDQDTEGRHPGAADPRRHHHAHRPATQDRGQGGGGRRGDHAGRGLGVAPGRDPGRARHQRRRDVRERPQRDGRTDRSAGGGDPGARHPGRRHPQAPAGARRAGRRILVGERRRAGRHGRDPQAADAAPGPQARGRDRGTELRRRRRGRDGDPRGVDHPRNAGPAGDTRPRRRLHRRLDDRRGSARSAASTSPEPATW